MGGLRGGYHVKDPVRNLAAGILHSAVRDWQKYALLRKPTNDRDGSIFAFETAQDLGFSTPRRELLAFFKSHWCEELCLAVDLDYRTMLKRLHISV